MIMPEIRGLWICPVGINSFFSKNPVALNFKKNVPSGCSKEMTETSEQKREDLRNTI